MAWIFILFQLLGAALFVTASPFDHTKKEHEMLEEDQKSLFGLRESHHLGTNTGKYIWPMNNPKGPEIFIQKGKPNDTDELLNFTSTFIQNATAHERTKRSPSYSRKYNVKNTMYSPPMGKSYGKSYRPSSYGGYRGPSGPYGGARAGRTAGRYSAEPMYGSPAGYIPVGGGGGGGGYSAGGYGGGYPAAPAAPSYGGYAAAAPAGYAGGYAPAPAGGGATAAAAAQDPYMIDEKALAKYIDKLTNGSKSRRRRRSGSNESHGSRHAKTRRRRRSKTGAKATGGSRRRRASEKAAKKGSRRRRTEKTSRRASRRRKSSHSSSSQEYDYDASAASYDEEPYSKPNARRARDNDQVKPLDMSEVYTTKPVISEPLNYPAQKPSQSDLLLSSLFSSLFQSAVTKAVPKPQTPAPPAPAAPLPQQPNVASELAKLGQMIQTTFRKMTSRLDGMKMARELRLKKQITPAPIDDDNFINSRSTSQWNNVVNRYKRT